MLGVVKALFGLYKQVVDIDFHGVAQQRSEYLSYQSLISCPSILQAKRHHITAYNPCGVMKVIFCALGECMGI